MLSTHNMVCIAVQNRVHAALGHVNVQQLLTVRMRCMTSQFSCAAGTISSDGSGDNANVVGSGEHVVGAHETFIQVEQLQKGLCGVSRPHFFRGVATVSLAHCLSALFNA